MAHLDVQNVPVRIFRSENRLVIAAPLPGLEANDISVRISGDRVTIRGQERGPRQNERDLLVTEWTVGPYEREVTLPQPVDGALANATYGNGVLVLSLPTAEAGRTASDAEFTLEWVEATRGERVGHSASAVTPVTTEEHWQRKEQTTQEGGGSHDPHERQ